MGFLKSNEKNMPVVGLLTHNDGDVLRAKTGVYRRATHRPIIPPTTDWLQPAKVKDVQSFIGFMNFYWRFIHDFSKIARPLHTLTRKSKDWSWGAAEQQAFDVLNSAVTSTPMLAFPSKSRPFCLVCDASNFAMVSV